MRESECVSLSQADWCGAIKVTHRDEVTAPGRLSLLGEQHPLTIWRNCFGNRPTKPTQIAFAGSLPPASHPDPLIVEAEQNPPIRSDVMERESARDSEQGS